MSMHFPALVRFILLTLTMLPLSHLTAQVLIQKDDVTVSVLDLQTELQRQPAAIKKQLLSNPNSVETLAANLFSRRVLAKQELTAFAADPAVTAGVQLAVDRYLSDRYLQRTDAEVRPGKEALETLALTTYKSDTLKFTQPEERLFRHILFKIDTPDAEIKAKQTLEQIKAGAEFPKLAKELSEDPGSAQRGGSLGTLKRGQTVREFDEAAFALKQQGDVAGPVKTEYGYHIVQLEEIKPPKLLSFDEVKASLIQDLASKAVSAKRNEQQQKIMTNVKINYEAIEAFAIEQKNLPN